MEGGGRRAEGKGYQGVDSQEKKKEKKEKKGKGHQGVDSQAGAGVRVRADGEDWVATCDRDVTISNGSARRW